MHESQLSTIIPVLDTQGNVVMPLSWKNAAHNTIMCTIKLDKDSARALGERLIKTAEVKNGNNKG